MIKRLFCVLAIGFFPVDGIAQNLPLTCPGGVCPSLISGNNLWLNKKGLKFVNGLAEIVGAAKIYAAVVNGFGYNPSDPQIVLPLNPMNSTLPLAADYADVAVAPVSPQANPINYPVCDEFNMATCASAGPVPQSGLGACGTTLSYPLNGSGIPSSSPTTTFQCNGGCSGAVTTCGSAVATYSGTGPWYQPYQNLNSCYGACVESAGVPYTGGCPWGDTSLGHSYATCASQYPTSGSSIASITSSNSEVCYCANPEITANSSAFQNALPPAAPAGSIQPPVIPPSDVAGTAAIVAQLQSAVTALQALASSSIAGTPTHQTLGIISTAVNILTVPTALPAGTYSPAPGSIVCSTCSSGGLPNGAGNPTNSGGIGVTVSASSGTSSSSGTVSGGLNIVVNVASVTLAGDGVALAVGSVTIFSSTQTFSGVYDEFVTERSSSPFFNMITGFANVWSNYASTQTFTQVLSFSTVEFGSFSYDFTTNGQLQTLINMLYWAVQASALVIAFFIIHG